MNGMLSSAAEFPQLLSFVLLSVGAAAVLVSREDIIFDLNDLLDPVIAVLQDTKLMNT
jgi:hypothetical protein